MGKKKTSSDTASKHLQTPGLVLNQLVTLQKPRDENLETWRNDCNYHVLGSKHGVYGAWSSTSYWESKHNGFTPEVPHKAVAEVSKIGHYNEER